MCSKVLNCIVQGFESRILQCVCTDNTTLACSLLLQQQSPEMDFFLFLIQQPTRKGTKLALFFFFFWMQREKVVAPFNCRAAFPVPYIYKEDTESPLRAPIDGVRARCTVQHLKTISYMLKLLFWWIKSIHHISNICGGTCLGGCLQRHNFLYQRTEESL